jgi:hypothetical protein
MFFWLIDVVACSYNPPIVFTLLSIPFYGINWIQASARTLFSSSFQLRRVPFHPSSQLLPESSTLIDCRYVLGYGEADSDPWQEMSLVAQTLDLVSAYYYPEIQNLEIWLVLTAPNFLVVEQHESLGENVRRVECLGENGQKVSSFGN